MKQKFLRLRIVVLLHLLAVSSVVVAESPGDGSGEFKKFLMKRQSSLSTIEALRMKGTLKITSGIADNAPEVTQYNFQIWAKRGRIKEILEALDNTGKAKQTEIYYLTTKQVAVVEGGSFREGKVFTLGRAENTGLFSECPAFLEYAFLHISIGDYGTPAFRPSDIASPDKWQRVVQSLRAVNKKKDGTLRAVLSNNDKTTTVDLAAPSGVNRGYQIRLITFFRDNEKTIDRKIEVLSYNNDRSFGNIGKEFKMSIFSGKKREIPDVTWEYKITDYQLNTPIKDELLKFDPASVDRIYDGDREVFITAPKR